MLVGFSPAAQVLVVPELGCSYLSKTARERAPNKQPRLSVEQLNKRLVVSHRVCLYLELRRGAGGRGSIGRTLAGR